MCSKHFQIIWWEKRRWLAHACCEWTHRQQNQRKRFQLCATKTLDRDQHHIRLSAKVSALQEISWPGMFVNLVHKFLKISQTEIRVDRHSLVRVNLHWISSGIDKFETSARHCTAKHRDCQSYVCEIFLVDPLPLLRDRVLLGSTLDNLKPLSHRQRPQLVKWKP